MCGGDRVVPPLLSCPRAACRYVASGAELTPPASLTRLIDDLHAKLYDSKKFREKKLLAAKLDVAAAVAPHVARGTIDARGGLVGLGWGNRLHAPARSLRHRY